MPKGGAQEFRLVRDGTRDLSSMVCARMAVRACRVVKQAQTACLPLLPCAEGTL